MPIKSSLYEILGVSQNASQKEIKYAYYELAKKMHPDKISHENITEQEKKKLSDKFKEITSAYETLSDIEKRKKYDKYGDEEHNEFEFMNPFTRFQKQQTKSAKIVQKINVTLEELYTGAKKNISIKKIIACKTCNATGANDPKNIIKCKICKGHGKINIVKQFMNFMQQIQMDCSECSGNGKTILKEHKCKTCNGNKIIEEIVKYEIEIKPGTDTKIPIILENKGNEFPEADLKGDIIIILEQIKHKRFTRNNLNLIYEHDLNVIDALCGTKFIIEHLDGRKISITYENIIEPNKNYYIRTCGMLHKNNHNIKGDLIIKFNIIYPKHITSEQKQEIKRIFNHETKIESTKDISFNAKMEIYTKPIRDEQSDDEYTNENNNNNNNYNTQSGINMQQCSQQ